ncbi:MAG TPA: gamma-glutamylcyclotransferase family protein [Gammaproteobacteria bacterium]
MRNGETTLLFVYGTLRRGYRHPMARRLAQQAHHLGIGRVNGRLYRVSHYPGLLPTTHPRDWVRGDLYDLCGSPALLARLDRYEGLGAGRRRGQYTREVARVWLDDETPLTAWLYVYRRPVQRLTRLFSGNFLRERRRPSAKPHGGS